MAKNINFSNCRSVKEIKLITAENVLSHLGTSVLNGLITLLFLFPILVIFNYKDTDTEEGSYTTRTHQIMHLFI